MKRIPQELLASIDILNTLNGGIIEPRLRLSQHATHRQIELTAPGIAHEQMKAEIHNNELTVYYVIPVEAQETEVQVPQIVYKKQIPYFVDRKRITANFDGQKLVVQLPFNELANGYHRDITVNK
ncbi:MAG: Hsp20/alpha crystallin family protein [Cyclobacteriaceae bacterium]